MDIRLSAELPAPTNPMGVARELIQVHQDDDGELTLRHWRGSWMQWQQTHWVEAEDKAIRSWLYERLESAEYWHVNPNTGAKELKPWRPNRHKVADALDALAAVAHTGEGIDPPEWLVVRDGPRSNPLRAQPNTGLDGPGGPHKTAEKYRATRANEIVACSNGLLQVGTRNLLELTPLFFNRVAVPFEYEPAAPKPVRWLSFLNQLWPMTRSRSRLCRNSSATSFAGEPTCTRSCF